LGFVLDSELEARRLGSGLSAPVAAMGGLRSITNAGTLAEVSRVDTEECDEQLAKVLLNWDTSLHMYLPQVTCNADAAEAAAQTVVEIELKDEGQAASYVPPLAMTFSK
jgi:hypothetical protein